jgi:tRNA (guanine37-N1)-methyltransferase
MVMKPEPLFAAVESLQSGQSCPVVYTTPQGDPLTQRTVAELARQPRMIVLCGRYEGIDERVCQALVTHQVSLGDYVLSGGELPALVLIDAVIRLLPGALGNAESAQAESFSDGLLEHPHYTRPAEFRGLAVPDELVNGDHAGVARWRRAQSLLRTLQRRPDLLATAELEAQDLRLLADVARQAD